MANEIKFVFVGDTADFDKAIDSIVKKTNKIKDVDKDANKVRKQAVNLEKVLASEYDKARKNAGSLTDITKKLAKEETKRLDINKKLSSETLSQSRRQSLLLERSKSQARTSGLKGAGIAGMGKLAAGTIVAARTTGITAAVKGTLSAIGEAEAIRGGALGAGKTIEQFQTEQFAASIHRSPKEVGEAINSLGLIIDKDLIKRLTESGDKLKIVSQILKNRMIPLFTFLADKMSVFGISLAATIQTIKEIGWKEVFLPSRLGEGSARKRPTPAQVDAEQRKLWLKKGTAPGEAGMAPLEQEAWKIASDKLNPSKFQETYKRIEAELKETLAGILGVPATGAAKGGAMNVFSDSLSRIGLFKTGGESQIQTMKKSLRQLEAIKKNTTNLKETVEGA